MTITAYDKTMADRFEAAIADLRPPLYRFCKRMTGSSLDAEDLVQETLAKAFEGLDRYDPGRPLKPWLFRIAHNTCIDFLRRAGPLHVEWDDRRDNVIKPSVREDTGRTVERALEMLVTALPPKERACVVLKDVLNYRLSDIATIVNSTVGGVKAALHRGRNKLKANSGSSVGASDISLTPAMKRLSDLYIDRFNRRDWDGVCDLLRADARLEIVGIGTNIGHDAFRETYFRNHARLPMSWRLEHGRIDGVPVLLEWRWVGERWQVCSTSRLEFRDGAIAAVRDYMHAAHVLNSANVYGQTPQTLNGSSLE